jgi:hypothetical protein
MLTLLDDMLAARFVAIGVVLVHNLAFSDGQCGNTNANQHETLPNTTLLP